MASRRSTRAERRARALARVAVPISKAFHAKDPLVHPRRGAAIGGIALLGAAVLVHLGVLGVFFAAGSVASRFSLAAEGPRNETIEVAVIQPPTPPVQPEPEPEPEPEKPKPKPEPKPKAKPVEPPPADPIDIPDAPPPQPDEPVRRVVGVSLESTVEGGGGPGFAVGNTRMGKTAKTAEAPEVAEPLPKPPKKDIPPPANRAATRVPTGTRAKLVKPNPIGGMKQPVYPPLYKAQGLEADVAVRASIDATGKVSELEVLAPSRHVDFNTNCRVTGLAQRYTPARRGDTPIRFTITYTCKFRIVD